MFKVSHSKVKSWRRCHYQYHLKYVEKLRRRVKSRSLTLGSLVHDALEAKLTGGNAKKIFDDAEKQLSKVFIEELVELDLQDAVPTARKIVDGYAKYWKGDGLKYRAAEHEFEVEIDDGILLVGFVDAIVEDGTLDRDGGIWILERKTCKKIPDDRTRETDIQSVIYWWAVPRARDPKTGKRWTIPRGIIWDYVRNKLPTEPEVLKRGGLSQRNMDTTPEVYLAAIKKHRLNADDYREMLASLEGKEDNFYRRIRLPFSQPLRDQVVHDFRQTAIQMRTLHGIAMDRNMTRDCSFCEFYDLCQARLRGLDDSYLLKKNYEVKKDEDHQESQEARRDSEVDP